MTIWLNYLRKLFDEKTINNLISLAHFRYVVKFIKEFLLGISMILIEIPWVYISTETD